MVCNGACHAAAEEQSNKSTTEIRCCVRNSPGLQVEADSMNKHNAHTVLDPLYFQHELHLPKVHHQYCSAVIHSWWGDSQQALCSCIALRAACTVTAQRQASLWCNGAILPCAHLTAIGAISMGPGSVPTHITTTFTISAVSCAIQAVSMCLRATAVLTKCAMCRVLRPTGLLGYGSRWSSS
jgi:hypothetical protein